MPPIDDRDYLKVCAQLANVLSISISSARRKVEIAAAREGTQELNARKEIAENMLKEAYSSQEKGEQSPSDNLDTLLKALTEDENFMVED